MIIAAVAKIAIYIGANMVSNPLSIPPTAVYTLANQPFSIGSIDGNGKEFKVLIFII